MSTEPEIGEEALAAATKRLLVTSFMEELLANLEATLAEARRSPLELRLAQLSTAKKRVRRGRKPKE
jgi:hypothetical protein